MNENVDEFEQYLNELGIARKKNKKIKENKEIITMYYDTYMHICKRKKTKIVLINYRNKLTVYCRKICR